MYFSKMFSAKVMVILKGVVPPVPSVTYDNYDVTKGVIDN